MKMTWKKGLAILLTLTLAFGFSLQAVATEAAPADAPVVSTPAADPNTAAPVADPNTAAPAADPNAADPAAAPSTAAPVPDLNAAAPSTAAPVPDLNAAAPAAQNAVAEKGTLVVTPVSQRRAFNGTTFTPGTGPADASFYTVSGLLPGHTLEVYFKADATITYYDGGVNGRNHVPLNIDRVVVRDAQGADVTTTAYVPMDFSSINNQYSLRLNQAPLAISTQDETATYNGNTQYAQKPIALTDGAGNSVALPQGFVLNLKPGAAQGKAVGDKAAVKVEKIDASKPDIYEVVGGQVVDRTPNYNISKVEGTFEIVAKTGGDLDINNISLQVDSTVMSKPFDGTPLIPSPKLEDGFFVVKTQLPTGYTVLATFSAESQVTYVTEGKVQSILEKVQVFDEKGDEVSKMAPTFGPITRFEGSLYITKANLTVSAQDEELVFSGEEQSASKELVLTDDKGAPITLPEGFVLNLKAGGKGTQPGTTDNKIVKIDENLPEIYQMVNGQPVDRAPNYKITKVGATLTIANSPATKAQAKLFVHTKTPGDTSHGNAPASQDLFFPPLANAPTIEITVPTEAPTNQNTGSGYAWRTWNNPSFVAQYASAANAQYGTIDQYLAAIAPATAPENFEIDPGATITWYVVKDQQDGWHIDGYVNAVPKLKVTYQAGFENSEQADVVDYVRKSEAEFGLRGENTFTREGYTFAGWKNQFDTAFEAGQTVTLDSINNQDQVLAAQWTKNAIPITVTTKDVTRSFTGVTVPSPLELEEQDLDDFYEVTGLPSGYTVVPTFSPESTVTYVTDGPNKDGKVTSVVSVRIFKDEQDVSSEFDITYNNTGTITVVPAKIEARAAAQEVTYNGQEQYATMPIALYREGELFYMHDNYFVNMKPGGKATGVGSVTNIAVQDDPDMGLIYEIVGGVVNGPGDVTGGESVDRTMNFDITYSDTAKFTVLPAPLVISYALEKDSISAKENFPDGDFVFNALLGKDVEADLDEVFSTLPTVYVQKNGGDKVTLDEFDATYRKDGLLETGNYNITLEGAVAKNGNYDPISYSGYQLTVTKVGYLAYSANGVTDVTGMPEAEGPYTNEKVAVSTAVPTAKGLTFLGWDTNPKATEPTYKAGEAAEHDFVINNADTHTLYAIWTVNGSFEDDVKAAVSDHESTYNGTYLENGQPKSVVVNIAQLRESDVVTFSYISEDGQEVQDGTTNPSFKNAGTYPVTVNVTRQGVTVSVTRDVVINRANVTLKVADRDITRGDGLPDFGLEISQGKVFEGVTPEEQIATLALGNIQYSTDYVADDPAKNKAGEYDVNTSKTPEASGNPNYTVSFEKGQLSVAPAFLVSYDANGGLGSLPEAAYLSQNSMPYTVLFDPLPQKDSFTFWGWSQDQASTNPEYKLGEGGQIEALPNADVVLYAIYRLDTSGALFNLNNIEKVYDGQASEMKVNGGLPEGTEIQYTVFETDENGDKGAQIGEASLDAPSFTNVLRDQATKAVRNYLVEASITVNGVPATDILEGTALIKPRPIAIGSQNAPSVTYNAQAQSGQAVVEDRTADIAADKGYTPGEYGLVDGHSFLNALAEASGTNVGTMDLQVFFSVKNAAGNDVSENYAEVTSGRAMGTFTIDKFEVLVQPDNQQMFYRGTLPNLTAQYLPVVEGTAVPSDVNVLDAYRALDFDKDYANENANTYTDAIVASAAGGTPDNYTLSFGIANLQILPAEKGVVITPIVAGKTYGDADPASFNAEVKFADGTDFTDTLNFSVSRVPGENAGTYELIVTLGDNPNYNITAAEGVLFTISPASVEIIPQNTGKIYGETDPALSATVVGAKNGESLNYTLSRATGENAGNYAISVAPGANPNYNVKVNPGVFTIAPREVNVIITPNNGGKVYGQEDPAFTATVTGTVNGDDLDYTITRAPGENAGNYQMNISLGNNPNYVVKPGTGVFTISPANVTLTVGNTSKVLGAADPALNATVEGLVQNDTLDYTLTRAPGEEVGSYAINATLGANPNYVVNVVPGVLQITVDANVPVAPIAPVNPDAGAGGGGGAPAPAPAAAAPAAPAAPAALPVVAPVVTANPLAGLGTLLGALTNLNDPANPLANQTVNIGDNEVPLAGFGGWALVNLLLAIATVLISLVLLATYFMGRRKKEQQQQVQDDDYEFEHVDTAKTEEETDPAKQKKKLIVRLVGVLVAVVSVIAFILTEDMTQPMVLIDNWTLLMAIITLVQVVVSFFAKKSRKEEENTEDHDSTQPMNV